MSNSDNPKISGRVQPNEQNQLREGQSNKSLSTPGGTIEVQGFGVAQRLTAYKKKLVAKSLQELIDAETAVVDAGTRNLHSKVSYGSAVVALTEFDEVRERNKIKKTYDIEEANQGVELANSMDAHAEAEHQAELASIRRAEDLEKAKNPPNKSEKRKRPTSDPEAEFDDILNYGVEGKNASIAERAIAKFIKQKGGEEALTEEDRENIRMARMRAAQKDNAKS